MYQNNIAERSSSRVLQRPGGHQSINLFGGADDSAPEPRRTGRRAITPNVGSAQTIEPKPATPAAVANTDTNTNTNTNTNIDPASEPDAKTASSSTVPPTASPEPSKPAAGQLSARVNNIWGSDDDVVSRSSTRVLRGPGGGSSGVAGALGGGGAVEPPTARRGGTSRTNQTSANSPFSSEPEPQRSSTKVQQAPGGSSNGNILSWGH